MAEAGAVLDVDALIDRSPIGRINITVAALGALVLFVDGFDTQVIGYITPQIAKNWHISQAMLGPIFSSGLVGLLVGYLVLAPLSGRFGHKRVVILSTAIFGALTFLTASAGSAEALIVFRFLTGVGLGGAIPSAVALTGEYCPRHRRSSFITFMYVGLTLGQVAAGALSATLLERYGWQSVLWVGGALPLLHAVLLYFALPESLEYLINRGRDRKRAVAIIRRIAPALVVADADRLAAGGNAQAVSVGELFRARRALGTLAIWVGLAMNLMINFFMQNWLPTIFINVGLGQQTAIIATTVSMAGGLIAAFVVGPLMDRLGPYPVMTALFLGGALFEGVTGVVLHAPVMVVTATSFCAGFCTSGIQKSANALAIYFYPTALRSTGLGWGLGVGRVGAIIGPLAAGFLLGIGWAPAGLFYVAALPMLVGALAIVLMGRFYARPAVDSPQPLAAAP
jgi:MFS transporter, AAHS family, 4-hydroxybenzoate transporter